MAWSMPRGLSAGSRPSRPPWQTIPRQAKRLVRWRMREEKSENPSFKTPIRPGRPPGYRRRDVHLVDELLSECDWLAHRATMPDTS